MLYCVRSTIANGVHGILKHLLKYIFFCRENKLVNRSTYLLQTPNWTIQSFCPCITLDHSTPCSFHVYIVGKAQIKQSQV